MGPSPEPPASTESPASTGSPRSPRSPWSLRTQLLAAFAVVAAVALVAGGTGVVWLMLGYRAQVTSERLRDAAVSAAIGGAILERQNATPEAIAGGIAAQVPLSGTRVLVLDSSGRGHR